MMIQPTRRSSAIAAIQAGELRLRAHASRIGLEPAWPAISGGLDSISESICSSRTHREQYGCLPAATRLRTIHQEFFRDTSWFLHFSSHGQSDPLSTNGFFDQCSVDDYNDHNDHYDCLVE